jgi:hypothetical protein
MKNHALRIEDELFVRDAANRILLDEGFWRNGRFWDLVGDDEDLARVVEDLLMLLVKQSTDGLTLTPFELNLQTRRLHKQLQELLLPDAEKQVKAFYQEMKEEIRLGM